MVFESLGLVSVQYHTMSCKSCCWE